MPAGAPSNAPVEDGPWPKGVDTYLEASQVQKSYYRWGINVSNRGGTVRTRPGFSAIPPVVGLSAPVMSPTGASPIPNFPLAVVCTCPDQIVGETMIYTLDGTVPSLTNGTPIPSATGYVTIPATNTTLNIIAVAPDGVTISLVDTEVYKTAGGTSTPPTGTEPNVLLVGTPRGITVFDDKGGMSNLVIAIGPSIYYTPYPFTDPFTRITALTFNGIGLVDFTRCIISVTEDANGRITDIDPIPCLMIQDGQSQCGLWQGGQSARHLNPAKPQPSEAPTGLACAWSGNRYWVSNGSRMRASNLLNPIKFTEENLLEEGGFLQFPGDIRTVINTFDFTALNVFTDLNTSTLQTSLLDRTQWSQTPGFQKVVFSGIGAAGLNAVTTQWGLIWWYTHDGLIGYDEGLRVYQTSKITYHDREMGWSKQNISPEFEDLIALGSFENLLFVSVPSGDINNAHTWTMDEAPLDTLTYWGYLGLPAWSGIWEGVRPIGWVTAHVQGRKRCFCLSKDYNGQNNVWEIVTKARMDKPVDANLNPVVKQIDCSLETKLLGYDGQYKFFRFAEIYLDNVEGEVDLTVSYAPRRGGWKQVLQKHIVASDFIMQNPNTVIPVDTFIFDPVRPQQRAVRTVSEVKHYSVPNSGDDIFQGIQTGGSTPYPRQKDLAFSLLLQWTGRLSITSVRAYFDPEEQETEGVVEVNEETDRTVDMAGINTIGQTLTPYVIDPLSQDFQSHTLIGTVPIWTDPLYDSTSQ